jgi:hypothetical protein
MNRPVRLRAQFNGCCIGIQCGTEWLATELRRRVLHVVTAEPEPRHSDILRITLEELEVSWYEARDSTGRCERGSFEFIAFHARKWMTAAFVAAQPALTWLHAAAASKDGSAVLLAGPAGSGKSTLLVQLIERGWRLLADDCVGVNPEGGQVLPFPFSPEVRAAPRTPGEAWSVFLAQPKTLAAIAPDQVSSAPATAADIIFPEYARDAVRPLITPLTVVSAAQALASQVQGGIPGREHIGNLFQLARQIPCYRLSYADSSDAGDELAKAGWQRES